MRNIALAVALGLLLGIIPKANLLAVLIATLLLLSSAHLVVGLAVAVCVSLATPWIAPFAHELGGFILTSTIGQQLGGLAFRLPLVPWTMLDNTIVLGSFLIGLVLFVPVFLLVWGMLSIFATRKNENALHAHPLPEREKTRQNASQSEAAKPSIGHRMPKTMIRLAILILFIIVAWFFRNEIIRLQAIRQIRSQSGADAELDFVRTDLLSGIVDMGGLRLFDPNDRSRNLISVQKIMANAAPKNLMQRYFHFPNVSLQGIHVDIDGADGSQIVPDKLWTKIKDSLPDLLSPNDGLDWIAFLADDPETVAKNLLNQLDSVKYAEQLRVRWPQEVEQIRKLADSLKERFANIKNYFTGTPPPGDKLELVGNILKELDGADQGVQKLLAAINELQTKARTDYDLLVAASKRDQTQLQSLKTPSVNTTNITESLLGNEIREQWNKTVAWGDWARSLLVPVELGAGMLPLYERFGLSPPKKVSGETIHFVAHDARPELLFDTVDLTGQIFFGDLQRSIGQTIFFNGTVKNIASPLELGPEPMIAQFCFSGSGVPASAVPLKSDAEPPPAILDPNLFAELYVTLIVDRLEGKEEDRLIVHCPLYELPGRILGDPTKIALNVSPGQSRLDGVINFQGEKIDGQIVLKQDSVRLAAVLPDQLRNSPLQRVLQETLNGLDGFDVNVLVSGTRSKPQYVFKSNIADKLRPQIENLVLAEWDGMRKKADGVVADEVNKAVAVLNDAIQKHLDPLIQEANGQKALLEQQIAQTTGVPLNQLLQSQLSQLSPQDQQKLGQFISTPLIQSLLKSEGTSNQVDQLLQRGTEKLQQKLPAALDKLLGH